MESSRLLFEVKNSMRDLRNIHGICSACIVSNLQSSASPLRNFGGYMTIMMSIITSFLYTNFLFCNAPQELIF